MEIISPLPPMKSLQRVNERLQRILLNSKPYQIFSTGKVNYILSGILEFDMALNFYRIRWNENGKKKRECTFEVV